MRGAQGESGRVGGTVQLCIFVLSYIFSLMRSMEDEECSVTVCNNDNNNVLFIMHLTFFANLEVLQSLTQNCMNKKTSLTDWDRR